MAGLTDGLGYAGFAPGATVQSLEESLTRAADASPGADGRVRVGLAPGTKWQYSGGGYTLLQLMIEEASGEVFESYMQRAVFQPLGMNRSTYALDPDKWPNLAPLYDADGKELNP
jgi:CubicO group peptidase (beta-lactamase class C family)